MRNRPFWDGLSRDGYTAYPSKQDRGVISEFSKGFGVLSTDVDGVLRGWGELVGFRGE